MEELQPKIVGLLEAAGGKMPYPGLLAEMNAFERQHLRGTLLVLRDAKKIKQQVAWDAENSIVTHTVELIGA